MTLRSARRLLEGSEAVAGQGWVPCCPRARRQANARQPGSFALVRLLVEQAQLATLAAAPSAAPPPRRPAAVPSAICGAPRLARSLRPVPVLVWRLRCRSAVAVRCRPDVAVTIRTLLLRRRGRLHADGLQRRLPRAGAVCVTAVSPHRSLATRGCTFAACSAAAARRHLALGVDRERCWLVQRVGIASLQLLVDDVAAGDHRAQKHAVLAPAHRRERHRRRSLDAVCSAGLSAAVGCAGRRGEQAQVVAASWGRHRALLHLERGALVLGLRRAVLPLHDVPPQPAHLVLRDGARGDVRRAVDDALDGPAVRVLPLPIRLTAVAHQHHRYLEHRRAQEAEVVVTHKRRVCQHHAYAHTGAEHCDRRRQRRRHARDCVLRLPEPLRHRIAVPRGEHQYVYPR
eukprot:CAMPEP_0119170096 /NCGR_PEP_ID=MMETSP1315-20130426/15720_1 /TAXON_ID=676789 /ORGANISM="Prasinoderma singularis, Strain RCC927" /LENGTH=400 /DNA_ID=CAMNT_0007163787 /DNA_START=183 /DNA_END=1382 /DNA_ORIENTATION=+